MERLGDGRVALLEDGRARAATAGTATAGTATATATARPALSGDGDPLPGVGHAPLPAWVRWTGWILLALQLVAMLVFSTVEYSRFALTNDFAYESQAWWAIAHGHLDPFSAGLGVSYWKNNAEFIMWPLSLLYYVCPHPITLLWVQDVSVVLTELVAFRWIRRVIEGAESLQPRRAGPWLALGAAVALVANPWVYETIAFDFHLQTVSTLFVVLVGYSLWAGRTRRLWLWVALALLSNALAGVCLVGVGVAGMLAGRRSRRHGFVIAATGLAWFLILGALGATGDGGQAFGATYGYLAGSPHGRIGAADIVLGVLRHPGSALHVAGSHWAVVLVFLVAFGAIGVLSPWGLGMTLAVLVPNALDASGHFIRPGASFQSWPAMPFLLVGSIMVLMRLLAGDRFGRRVAAVAVAVWAVFLVELAVVVLPSVPGQWLAVDPPAAAALGRVAAVTPAGAEVIASQGVVGRFGQRAAVFGVIDPHQTIPVTEGEVVFVLTPGEGIDDTLAHQESTAAVSYVRRRLHARPVLHQANVYAFTWSPPPGTTSVTLP